MNLGLGNLKELKLQLLAEALRAGEKYNATISAIGAGIAGQFERYCNRKFARVENATYQCQADRPFTYLDRYPLESISAVHLKVTDSEGWVTQTGLIQASDYQNGKVGWGAAIGDENTLLRFTFTGGFWFNTNEAAVDTMPEGAFALPAELRQAWFTQCRIGWQAIDKLGVDITKTGSSSQFVTGTLAGLKLSEDVEATLKQFRRFV